MAKLSRHLRYVWPLIGPLYGLNGGQTGQKFSSRYQLALLYVKSRYGEQRISEDWLPGNLASDRIPNDRKRDKGDHEHRKNVSQMQFLIESLSKEGDLICDPTAGSWTTAVACALTARRFVGADDRPDCIKQAQDKFKLFYHS